MNASNRKLGYFAGATALILGLGVLSSSSGCDEAAEQCGLTCPDQGVAEGNAGISGFVAIDSFFRSVVNFKTVANGVAADINAELDGIQASFGITDAELTAKGSIGAALKAKIEGQVSLKIDAQPAKCEVDASISASASVDCQVAAGCEIDPGMASVSCMGECTVEASAEGKCSGDATLKCTASGPSVACTGSCTGSCSVVLAAAASCEGTCDGECNGECAGNTATGGRCNGQCMAMCKGTCEVSGSAAASCTGTCNGSCEVTAPQGGCQAGAKVECEFMAKAEASCTGRCDGEFTPPSANCDASASCQASAKAEAKFEARCTPPSVDIQANFTGGAEAEARFTNAIGDLKVRLPRLLAALKRASFVIDAGTQLGTDGAAAIQGTLGAFGKGDVGVVAAYRIATCVPDELTASSDAIKKSGAKLSAQITAAAGLTGTL